MKTKHFFNSDFTVKGKSADEIFRRLCTDHPDKQLNNVKWKEVFINRFGQMMLDTPNPRKIVEKIINEGLEKQGLKNIDPETTYFNIFSSSDSSDGNVFHYNSLSESYRVTDACLMNIFVERYFDDWDLLNSLASNGIYSVGKEGAYYPDHDYGPEYNPVWGPNEQIYHSRVIADILYARSVWDEFKKYFMEYWQKYAQLYTEMLSDTFLAMAIQQYTRQTLTDEGFLMVCNTYYGNKEEVQITLLDIYGYPSTDIICIEQKGLPTPKVILYIPGGTQPFVEFLNTDDLKQWIAWHLKDNKHMVAFRKHFSLKQRQEGETFTGIDKALQYIAEESPEWPANKYILYNPTHLETENLFNIMMKRTEQRMLEDSDVQIRSNSEATRDYALSLLETFISQLSAIDMLVPAVGIPINFALSATALGLSSDIVVNGDSYEKRKYGIGSLVQSALFTGINLIPVISETAEILSSFSRTEEDIPAFFTEEQALAQRFEIVEEELHSISPDDPPREITDENLHKIRLVRLNNENQPLVVLRRLGGNKFIRIEPITFQEIKGSLVSEVINPVTNKTYYVSNAKLLGGSPYSPFRIGLEGVWTPEVLKARASVIGKPIGESYKRILAKLQRIHNSNILDERQGLMHELMELIDLYEESQPSSERLNAFRELRTQLEKALYLPEMEALKKQILQIPNKGSGAARFLLRTAMNEMAGKTSESTADLIRFALQDTVISAPFRGYAGAIPEAIDFPVKYVIEDISVFDKIQTNYWELPAYESWNEGSNSALLPGLLRESQSKGILSKCRIIENSLYIGHSYEEMFYSISPYSNQVGGPYELYPFTFFSMLQEVQGDLGFEQAFATRNFFNTLVSDRLSLMENTMLLTESFDYTPWDAIYGDINYDEQFAAMSINERIEKCMNTYRGVAFQNSSKSIDFFLNNLTTFIDNGLTEIAISDLPYDIVQQEISQFLQGSNEWKTLDAMLFNLDKGDINGAFRKLLQSAKDNNIKFRAIGHSDNSVPPFNNPYKSLYYKGNIIAEAIEKLDREGQKFVVFADSSLLNSTPGTGRPMPGLVQYLKIPATVVDSDGAWQFLPDVASSRVPIEVTELENWQVLTPPQGKILGLKQFKLTAGFPTEQSRLPLLENSVSEDLREELMQKIDAIKNDVKMNSLVCMEAGSCDSVSPKVAARLKDMGLEAGMGASITWWRREGGMEFSHQMHTTASFKFAGKEFAVDASHLQFVHDQLDTTILILPVDDWALEIAQRNRAINPFVEYVSKTGNMLALFMPPLFTKPRLTRAL
ncbi:membrane-targeted effector domain-containing toxin [Pasteurella multocida]|uniref:dermonecrotic toxin ToxA n=1 Tax=Pasteurella multocida TaxID=747 RepID=UPI002A5263F5|nr:dermonecrotic toxin ToxA [Pasteurella multocida]MDY0488996.1 membrane-targeted effector domain-containing toxin [Pasteurella multocida]MDY0595797.1 membrane-targeted effector domain-containing toxin [Pasteurella multocida]MDY0665198.1 membrane-targeted effector domain-containing toxin [Pasteurella multocida]MDY0667024.1 membrane-targeted effector domain-containing toxin [Pasteurella multocida]